MVMSGGATYRGDDIGGLGREIRVAALAGLGFASREINLVDPQKPPDILNANVAKRLG